MDKQFDVSAYLHKDANMPVTTAEISAQSGVSTRAVRQAIRRAIMDGTPVLHDNASGHWLAEDQEQKSKCVRSLRKRAREISKTADALEVCEVPGGEE